MSETRDESFALLQPSIPALDQKVLNYIKRSGVRGCTLFELVVIMQLPASTLSGRITNLCDNKHVQDSGERRVNPASNRRGVVWKAAA